MQLIVDQFEIQVFSRFPEPFTANESNDREHHREYECGQNNGQEGAITVGVIKERKTHSLIIT